MIRHYHANFLHDEAIYAEAEAFWIDLWNQVDLTHRDLHGWTSPWFEPLPPSISEGNPIFSAVSSSLRRGIRILQYEPTEKGLEFYAYLDTFGGTIFDPSAINELVISCALSDVSASKVLSLMINWIANEQISFELESSRVFRTSRSSVFKPYVGLFPSAA